MQLPAVSVTVSRGEQHSRGGSSPLERAGYNRFVYHYACNMSPPFFSLSNEGRARVTREKKNRKRYNVTTFDNYSLVSRGTFNFIVCWRSSDAIEIISVRRTSKIAIRVYPFYISRGDIVMDNGFLSAPVE